MRAAYVAANVQERDLLSKVCCSDTLHAVLGLKAPVTSVLACLLPFTVMPIVMHKLVHNYSRQFGTNTHRISLPDAHY